MRYVTLRPSTAAWWDWPNASDFIARTVHEKDAEPADTGLLNADGVKIYRVEDRRPIGFTARHSG